jgi:O-antigen polysaccharide polymerase Wzy
MAMQSVLRRGSGRGKTGQPSLTLAFLPLACALVGFFLYFSPQLSLKTAAFYSCFSALLAVLMAFNIPNRSRSWLFWFTCFYFLFYQLGTVMGVLLIGFDVSLVNYATNFSNFISSESVTKAYVASGLCISVIWSLAVYMPTHSLNEENNLPFDPRMYQIGIILLILTLPPIIFDLIDQFLLVRSQGYSFFYTSGFQDRASRIPAIGLIRTVNSLAFYMLFASKPSARRFWIISIFFLLVAALDSLKGARSTLIVPVSFIVWHAAVYYGLRIKIGRSFLLVGGAVTFLILMAISRSSDGSEGFAVTNFLVYGLSKAQYSLALVLDNYQNVDVRAIFAFEPVIFPIRYMIQGSDIVGQSETTALLRLDLNHTFSSQLNLGAYLSGAGIGSSFVAEALQFGPLIMLAFLLLWFLFNVTYFKFSQKSRLLFLIQPIIFMHIAFSPRNSIFLSTWPILKIIVIFMIIQAVVQLLPKRKHHAPQ